MERFPLRVESGDGRVGLLCAGPNRIVLYQKNIEAHAEDVAAEGGRSVEVIIREEVRLTVLHEFGHYFGLDEEALKDV